MKFDRPVIAKIPVGTPNHDLALKSLQVMEAVRQSRQWGLGHVITGLRHSVQNTDPAARAAIQRNVDELAQATGLFFAFSIWDEAFVRSETKEILEKHMAPEKVHMFRAYRHMRNSSAHFYSGKRARQNGSDYSAFDGVMTGAQPFQSVVWDADHIDIADSMVGWKCLEFLEEAATQLFGKLANGR